MLSAARLGEDRNGAGTHVQRTQRQHRHGAQSLLLRGLQAPDQGQRDDEGEEVAGQVQHRRSEEHVGLARAPRSRVRAPEARCRSTAEDVEEDNGQGERGDEADGDADGESGAALYGEQTVEQKQHRDLQYRHRDEVQHRDDQRPLDPTLSAGTRLQAAGLGGRMYLGHAIRGDVLGAEIP